ncbi:hypothetical protein HYH02_013279 [Chlamydomonas schloesseri]|uniref:Uncharacterized protein n=1 Tax=Chlamydomonas schloesseri TaxID=2026947 RepID=A0A835T4T5_9CHLO|nr:hypothetical protein HYH02_013279 [Chlamydomonas schloesseri]|eukprot:KAG2431586.1 hypothetical protein HYH02_013279 [Chlamydomonas schloesseri]
MQQRLVAQQQQLDEHAQAAQAARAEIARLNALLAGGGAAGDAGQRQQQQQGVGEAGPAANPVDAGEAALVVSRLNEDALLRNSGIIEISAAKAKELGLSLSELVAATVNSLKDVVKLLRGELPRDSDRIATWLFIRLQPVGLREDLRRELDKRGGVIESWDWLAEWFRGRIAASEEPSQLVLWVDIKGMGEVRSLQQFFQAMSEWDRLIVSGKVDLERLKILHALSILPPKVRNSVLRRTTHDGRVEEWTDYGSFDSLLRSYAPLFPDYGKSADGASGAGGSGSGGHGGKKRAWEGAGSGAGSKHKSGAGGGKSGAGGSGGSKSGGATGGAAGKRYAFDMGRTKALWVKDQTPAKRQQLQQQGKCYICEEQHMHWDCKKRGPDSTLYKSGAYYYYDK